MPSCHYLLYLQSSSGIAIFKQVYYSTTYSLYCPQLDYSDLAYVKFVSYHISSESNSSNPIIDVHAEKMVQNALQSSFIY